MKANSGKIEDKLKTGTTKSLRRERREESHLRDQSINANHPH